MSFLCRARGKIKIGLENDSFLYSLKVYATFFMIRIMTEIESC